MNRELIDYLAEHAIPSVLLLSHPHLSSSTQKRHHPKHNNLPQPTDFSFVYRSFSTRTKLGNPNTMTLFLRANDALKINPPYGADETLSLAGSDWLWAVMAVHLLAFVSANTNLFFDQY